MYPRQLDGKRVFVTVGTTKFEKLIDEASTMKVLNKLYKMGYKTVIYQTGKGKYEQRTHPYVRIDYCPYFENFEEEIEKSDLVISHAGAGSCIDVLRAKKPLIIVVNEKLMDNHQVELAEQLQKDGFLYYCTCDSLLATLDRDLKKLRKFPPLNKRLFGKYVDKTMGFP